MADAIPVTTATNRAAEELRSIQGHDGDVLDGATLTYLTWHVANLVRNATGGRYELVLRRQGVDVEPIEMRDDKAIPRLVIEAD